MREERKRIRKQAHFPSEIETPPIHPNGKGRLKSDLSLEINNLYNLFSLAQKSAHTLHPSLFLFSL